MANQDQHFIGANYEDTCNKAFGLLTRRYAGSEQQRLTPLFDSLAQAIQDALGRKRFASKQRFDQFNQQLNQQKQAVLQALAQSAYFDSESLLVTKGQANTQWLKAQSFANTNTLIETINEHHDTNIAKLTNAATTKDCEKIFTQIISHLTTKLAPKDKAFIFQSASERRATKVIAKNPTLSIQLASDVQDSQALWAQYWQKTHQHQATLEVRYQEFKQDEDKFIQIHVVDHLKANHPEFDQLSATEQNTLIEQRTSDYQYKFYLMAKHHQLEPHGEPTGGTYQGRPITNELRIVDDETTLTLKREDSFLRIIASQYQDSDEAKYRLALTLFEQIHNLARLKPGRLAFELGHCEHDPKLAILIQKWVRQFNDAHQNLHSIDFSLTPTTAEAVANFQAAPPTSAPNS